MAILKVMEVLAESNKSWEDAAKEAVREASETLENIRSIYIKEFKANGGEQQHHQVRASSARYLFEIKQ